MYNCKMKSHCFLTAAAIIFLTAFTACNDDSSSVSMNYLLTEIERGSTSVSNEDRLLIVDVRPSGDYLEGHIKGALSAPLSMFASGTEPLYTNGYDEVSTTAADGIENSWLAHILINQLTNDYVSTYENNEIIFYGAAISNARDASEVAQKAGYTNVSFLGSTYAAWYAANADYTQTYCNGVASVDEAKGSFVLSGYINNTNFENVTTYGTHNCIIYEGGSSHNNGIFQMHIAPFCFQELLTYLGANPEGNMANGIDFGSAEEWSAKHVNGQRIDYSITWDGADRYYSLEELFEERPSAYQPDPALFVAYGIEPRIGGTRDSNINWNPGCLYCSYSCVCGITSNAKVNDHTWYADGGIYDLMNSPDDPRNYYAGRFFPRTKILPGEGTPVQIKVKIIE